MACWTKFKSEFKWSNFLLQHTNPQTFVQFYCGYQKCYAIYRTFWAVYHFGVLLFTGIDWQHFTKTPKGQGPKWFLYLSNWAFLVLTLAVVLEMFVILWVYNKRDDIRTGDVAVMPWYMRIHWLTHILSNSVTITISIMYWSILFSPNTHGGISAISMFTHFGNSLYVLLNISITGTPTRLFHFWIPAVFGFVYTLFTLFFFLAGGTNPHGKEYIYKELDWSRHHAARTASYTMALTFLILPGVHFLVYAIGSIKYTISSKCCITNKIPTGSNQRLLL